MGVRSFFQIQIQHTSAQAQWLEPFSGVSLVALAGSWVWGGAQGPEPARMWDVDTAGSSPAPLHRTLSPHLSLSKDLYPAGFLRTRCHHLHTSTRCDLFFLSLEDQSYRLLWNVTVVFNMKQKTHPNQFTPKRKNTDSFHKMHAVALVPGFTPASHMLLCICKWTVP